MAIVMVAVLFYWYSRIAQYKIKPLVRPPLPLLRGKNGKAFSLKCLILFTSFHFYLQCNRFWVAMRNCRSRWFL